MTGALFALAALILGALGRYGMRPRQLGAHGSTDHRAHPVRWATQRHGGHEKPKPSREILPGLAEEVANA